MNLGSEGIRHSQVHLPNVSAKHRIRQCVEIAVQNPVRSPRNRRPSLSKWAARFLREVFHRKRPAATEIFALLRLIWPLVIPIQLAYPEFSRVALHRDLGCHWMAIAKQVAQSPANECRAGIGNEMQTDAMISEPQKNIACFFSPGGERGIVSLYMDSRRNRCLCAPSPEYQPGRFISQNVWISCCRRGWRTSCDRPSRLWRMLRTIACASRHSDGVTLSPNSLRPLR